MNCPKCDAPIKSNTKRCVQCGQDLSIINKVIRISNTYYNDGLEKAKVRDLSGAIVSLKKSLQFNKSNTNARNLLGLVYCEMGETVSALSEWVLSKHFKENDNIAEYYINQVQSNPSRLESINQTIKKYNSALTSAQNGSADLAIIQLKKVSNLNPKFIRAQQLLALLYIKAGENQKAVRCLRKIRHIDHNNTLTLRYLKEIGGDEPEREQAVSTKRPVNTASARKGNLENVRPVGTYKEDKPQVLPFINVLIGIMIGLAVAFILIRPTLVKMQENQKSEQVRTLEDQLADLTSKNQSLQNENDTLKQNTQKDATTPESTEAPDTTTTTDTTAYDKLMDAVQLYNDNKKSEAALALVDIDENSLTSESAKKIYNSIKSETASKASKDLFVSGRGKYNSGDYEKASTDLQNALKLDPKNVDAMYFLGRTYQKQDDTEKAKEYFNMIIKDYEKTTRGYQAKSALREIEAASKSD